MVAGQASVVLYTNSATGQHETEGPAAGDRTTATLTMEEVQSNYSVLRANLALSPGRALLDPQTQHLKQDLGVLVVLVISMLLYIACWWRHLRPDAEKPTNPAPVPVKGDA